MMSTPPPLLLYIYYFLVVVLFFISSKGLEKNLHTTTTPQQQQQKTPYNWDQAIDWFMNFFFEEKVLLQGQNHSPPLSLLYLALYIKLQVPIIYLQTSSVTLFCLFVSAWLYIKWYGHKTCYIYIYLQWWTKVWYVLYYYYYLCYILLLFFVFLPKSYCFFVAIKQHPHLLQTYND